MGPMGLAGLHVEISRLLIVMWSLPAFIASSACLGTESLKTAGEDFFFSGGQTISLTSRSTLWFQASLKEHWLVVSNISYFRSYLGK